MKGIILLKFGLVDGQMRLMFIPLGRIPMIRCGKSELSRSHLWKIGIKNSPIKPSQKSLDDCITTPFSAIGQ
jgi:hypothetical protein